MEAVGSAVVVVDADVGDHMSRGLERKSPTNQWIAVYYSLG